MANKKISDLTSAAALDGTELYEASQAGGSVKVTGDAVRNGKVKVYRALLSQSGTDAPVAVVLENTLGNPVVWTRIGTGQYRGSIAGNFDSSKTFLLSSGNYGNDGAVITVTIAIDFTNSVDLNTFESGAINNDPTDDWGAYIPVQILVYP